MSVGTEIVDGIDLALIVVEKVLEHQRDASPIVPALSKRNVGIRATFKGLDLEIGARGTRGRGHALVKVDSEIILHLTMGSFESEFSAILATESAINVIRQFIYLS